MKKAMILSLITFFSVVSCSEYGIPVTPFHFKSYPEMVQYFQKKACSEEKVKLSVYNYDKTKYTPKIITPCSFDLENYDRRNLCYLSFKDRKDGINITLHSKEVFKRMYDFVTNYGHFIERPIRPENTIFVLELEKDTSIKTVEHILMALSVLYQDIRDEIGSTKLGDMPIILTDKELYKDL